MGLYLLHCSISVYPQANLVGAEILVPSMNTHSGMRTAAGPRQKIRMQPCLPCSSPPCSALPSIIRGCPHISCLSPLSPSRLSLFFAPSSVFCYYNNKNKTVVRPSHIVSSGQFRGTWSFKTDFSAQFHSFLKVLEIDPSFPFSLT